MQSARSYLDVCVNRMCLKRFIKRESTQFDELFVDMRASPISECAPVTAESPMFISIR